MALSATNFFISLAPLFKSFTRFVVSTGLTLATPYKYLYSKTFLHFAYTSFQLNLLLSIASLIFAMDVATSSGRQSISLPAISDCAAICPPGKNLATPFIPNASVKVNPLKCSLLRKRPVTFFLDNEVAVLAVVSIAGIYKCAIITLPTPALNICSKGYNSSESSCFMLLLITGRSRCESTETSPWPGKCLAHASTPSLCMAFI